jgi:hypothetical protein
VRALEIDKEKEVQQKIQELHARMRHEVYSRYYPGSAIQN